jgi:hypothetical protein
VADVDEVEVEVCMTLEGAGLRMAQLRLEVCLAP